MEIRICHSKDLPTFIQRNPLLDEVKMRLILLNPAPYPNEFACIECCEGFSLSREMLIMRSKIFVGFGDAFRDMNRQIDEMEFRKETEQICRIHSQSFTAHQQKRNLCFIRAVFEKRYQIDPRKYMIFGTTS